MAMQNEGTTLILTKYDGNNDMLRLFSADVQQL